nr:PREDICTED: emerin-like [Latimeria chalumnae]|eukprot:XP_014339902.1 PREDICTED: emerin-like [Latimeria chalumnae]
MEDLKNLSDHELLDLLKKYDIPHGPIVETTRQLYEKKLQNYLTKGKTSPSPKSSPMQTDGAGGEPFSSSWGCGKSYSRE